MWHSESAPQTSRNGRLTGSSATLNKKKSQSTSRLSRAISFQFLFRSSEDSIDHDTKCYIKMRYKDVAKHIIWPSCRIEGPIHKEGKEQRISDGKRHAVREHWNKRERRQYQLPPKPAPLEPHEPVDPRAVLFKAEIEDERTPYLAATINSVLRSDSEDSSDTEDVINITRL